MTLVAVGPFPGLKINRKLRKQMTLDMTNTRKKFSCNSLPLNAVKTARIASRVIRNFIDQMNFKRELNYNLSDEVIAEINRIFLDTDYDLKCLMDLTINNIMNRVNPYPLKSLEPKIYHQRIQVIEISCTEIW